MKYIKKFENIKEIQVGDYVICDEGYLLISDDDFDYFLRNNVGKCINIVGSEYIIEYKNIPSNIENYFRFDRNGSYNNLNPWNITNCRRMDISEIIFHSENKEDCEAYISANKYNL